ncbi:toprim domain-containing protein [Algicola sagamiensis]|uniref:toprim domain-containing protein n=1 Tax=Algicola sagamiensis TaxID=163869 RepID=UPI00036EFB82|nr:toprim domain-containing protein [Algicola sagamiensis]
MAKYVLEEEIVQCLLDDHQFSFKERGKYLQNGICPSCGKKELFVSKQDPRVVKCNRLNNCGFSEHVRELYPELFNQFTKRFPKTESAPNATADAYLKHNRQFDITAMEGWYTQELYELPDRSRTVPTVRFYIDDEKTRYWERLIDVSKEQAKQRNNIAGRRKHFDSSHEHFDEYHGTLVKGEWWTPPGQEIGSRDKVFLVEGIFHAIALHSCGLKVAATLMAGNFPFLSMRPHYGKKIHWIWALDDDPAGREFMLKHRDRLRNVKEISGLALTGSNLDWDDLYRRNKITPKFVEECRYRGRLFGAVSVMDKAWYWHQHTKQYFTVLDFNHAYFCIDVNKDLSRDLEHEGIEPGTDDAKPLFMRHAKITQISNVLPDFLYCRVAQYTGEISYDFQVAFANGSSPVQISLPGSAIEGPGSFNKALLAKAAGANFIGKSREFNYLTRKWFGKRVKQVETISFTGYYKECQAYIFNDFAYRNGKRIDVNQHGFFNLDKRSIKSVSSSLSIEESDPFQDTWLSKYHKVFHANGMTVLAYWLGSLFAEQIRSQYKSWPFLEMSGEPGTGKSTVLEFLWRCLGRNDHEGIDPSKATFAARARAFMQVSNMPVVLIEGDRSEDNAKRASFDYDEVKTAFNGRAIRSMGVMNRGSDTEEPPFRASIIFAQNAQIEASPAMMERIIHVHFTQAHFTQETAFLAPVLEQMTTKELGGFLHRALSLESKILAQMNKHYDSALKGLKANPKLTNVRLIKNHAQLIAIAMCLPLVFPSMTEDQLTQTVLHIEDRCLARHQSLQADHPLIARFWEIYELLNEAPPQRGYRDPLVPTERLNHSKSDGEIAINLAHFYQVCMENRTETINPSELKKLLPTSKRYKCIEQNKSMRSQILEKTVRCWVFRKS